MLRVERVFRLPETGFTLVQGELRSPTLIIIRRRMSPTLMAESLLSTPSKRNERWPSVTLLLDGHAVVEHARCEAELAPGQLTFSDDFGMAPLRTLGDSALETVTVAWRDSHEHQVRAARGSMTPEGASRTRGRGLSSAARPRAAESATASPSLRLAATHLATELSGAHPAMPRAEVSALVRALRASGFPLPVTTLEKPEETASPSGYEGWTCRRALTSPEAHANKLNRFGRALAELMGGMSDRTMRVDLSQALGCSERTVTRLAAEYFRTLHLSVDGWRDYIVNLRLWLAVAAMGSVGARTEVVSRSLGFKSPVALCHAFAAARLPSPGGLRNHLVRGGSRLASE